MNLANIIAALQSGMDPNQAIVNASMPGGGVPSPAPGGAPAPMPGTIPEADVMPAAEAAQMRPPIPTTPEGAKTPVTNPQPSASSPTAMQSPPDLANMYVQLMKQNQNAAAMDSGLTLLAAGLTPHQQTRQALIGLAGQGGGSGKGSGISSADLINLQNQQQKMKDLLLRRSLLGGLAKEYNLSDATVTALETSGKLDEVIQNRNTQNLLAVDHPDGTKWFHSQITGAPIVQIGGAKPVTGIPIKTEEGPTKIVNPQTSEQIGGDIGGPKVSDAQKTREQINTERKAAGLPEVSTEEFVTSIQRSAPNATNEAILSSVNKGRPADKQMSMEDLLKILHPQTGTNVNIGADGSVHPAPQPGFDWRRTPDGKVWIDPATGTGEQLPVNVKQTGGATETKLDIEKKQRDASEFAKKEVKQKVAESFASSNVGSAVDKALELADKPGATGTFAKWGRTLSPVTGMSWDTLDAKIKTIDANNVVQTLNQMRQASPSGGALGNVTESENKMLTSVIASPNVYQDTAEFKKSLIRIKAAVMVMAENNYDKPGDEQKFLKDLNERVEELSVAQHNKGGKSKIERVK